jgi:hypothetical protein
MSHVDGFDKASLQMAISLGVRVIPRFAAHSVR